MSGLKGNLVEGKFFAAVIRKIDDKLARAGRKLIYKKGSIKNNKIFIMTYDDEFACNPRYIAEELIAQKLPVEIVWAVNKKTLAKNNFPPEIKTVKRKTAEMFAEQASAKIWIDNGLSCLWYGMPKKKEQVYINTWHGSLGIKRLGGDSFWMKTAARLNKETDFVVANSSFEEEVYRQSFWRDTPVLKLGHARNDVLFNKEKTTEIKGEIAKFFGFAKEKNILLYAPTFRDNADVSCFNVDFEKLKASAEKRFGGEWVVLIRMHFKNRNRLSFATNDWLFDAGSYSDMQQLMIAADAGVTDYSSWAYDYVLTGKPVFLYVPDLEKYEDGRGFYYPLQETPFALCKDNESLRKAVETFDAEVYRQRTDEFLEKRGCYEKGDSAKKVVEKIKEILEIQ